MNTNTPTPNPAGDDLDRLFAAYFQAEMPKKWPAAPRPWADKPRAANTSPRTDPSHRSRWALAASVALLIGSCWYLSGHITDGRTKPQFNPDGTASPTAIEKNLGKDKADPKVAPIPGMP
ncbi:MAG TPA: hypothetical protein VKE40_11605 [Gemmataceae bacterium]|nr:hypothetical protein [Gemmataceae bacterium]